MSWLSPAIDHAEIRQRFPEMTAFACDPAIIQAAIDDAENIMQPRFESHWQAGAALAGNAAVKTIVRKLAVANVYRSSWGMAAFAGTWNDAAKAIRAEAFEEFDLLSRAGNLAGVSRGSPIHSNFADSKRIFDMGEETGWPTPTATEEPETEDDRRFA